MPFGLKISDDFNDVQKKKITSLFNIIKNFIARYGFDDEEWAQAISSQYFLLCLSEQLQWKKKDYENLLNKCLSSFSITYTGDYVLDSNKLLITPAETSNIIECMKKEDAEDTYYLRSAKLSAKNINSQQMYLNFHYGLLIRIVSSEDTEILRAIKHSCLDNILSAKALDSSNGWYPYRVPWITARILISLKSVNYSSYPKVEKLNQAIDSAISSLFQRIDEKAAFWRSGVGEWVSKWESTALCLEALFIWDAIDEKKQRFEKLLNMLVQTKIDEAGWKQILVLIMKKQQTRL